ncbi:alpha/beta hydrolase [Bariatricus sp. SGI.154]|uniref:alpha/beta hydrolase n=1 Tax=Bariatricus sp. SGI.154 TaxID=3420549 RepID=UPI003CFDE170
MKKDKKIAVIFPGIGYHCDKPLLYYSKKLAIQNGYVLQEVPYGNFPQNVKGNAEKMEQSFYTALEQAEDILKDIVWEDYSHILFISKSIGTAVAAAYAAEHGLETRNIFYTPVEQSFRFMGREGIVFHGTSDPWVKTSAVRRGCEEKELTLYITEDANHSLETGDVQRDLENMRTLMRLTVEYIE